MDARVSLPISAGNASGELRSCAFQNRGGQGIALEEFLSKPASHWLR